MNIFKIVTLSVISFFVTNTLLAHALWIESNTIAEKGVKQQVRLYYGEYNLSEIEPITEWYSDLNEVELWLTSPNGSKTKLPLTNRKDFFESEYLPTEDGIYYIQAVHATKDLGGSTKYEFSTFLTVAIGDYSKNIQNSISQDLVVKIDPKLYVKNQDVTLTILKNNQPLAKADVLVMSSSGWMKTYQSDANGLISFPALWSGNYVIEASQYKEESGDWHGKAYSHTWQGSTSFLTVK